MTYDFNFAISATINAATVEAMVKKCVEEQSGRRVKSITFTNRIGSDYMDRYSRTVFDGCTVTFEVDSVSENQRDYGMR